MPECLTGTVCEISIMRHYKYILIHSHITKRLTVSHLNTSQKVHLVLLYVSYETPFTTLVDKCQVL